MLTTAVIIDRTPNPDISAPHHDHSKPARHRPLQVHDDASGASPLSGRPGRIPLQVPQSGCRPGAVRGADPRGGAASLLAAVQGCRVELPALDALHQERLRRLSRPVPPEREVHQDHSAGFRRTRHPHRRAMAAHHPVRVPVLAIVNEVYFRNTQPRPTSKKAAGGSKPRSSSCGLRASKTSRSPTTARGVASPTSGTKRCCARWARSSAW